ncbi:MAG: SWIM zinc finger family protein [Gordonibacter sp.]|uniref:SWIM zinc finger family protein n=1 Tax=Gordonibacter sp. TaxID=1968902 RepID=UPI002FCC0647
MTADFSPLVAARGREYYQRGNVGSVEELAPNLYHAVVDGTVQYDVDIRFKGDRVVSAACTCPYEGWCKHAAAVELAVKDLRAASTRQCSENLQTRDESKPADVQEHPFPHNIYDTVMAFLMQQSETVNGQPTESSSYRKGKGDGDSLLFDDYGFNEAMRQAQRAQGADPIEPLSIDRASRILSEALVDPEAFDFRYDRYGDFADDDIDLEAVASVLLNAKTCTDPAQGALIALAALDPLARSLECHHEGDSGEYEAIYEALAILEERCEYLAAKGSTTLRSFVLCALIETTRIGAIAGWITRSDLLRIAANLAYSRIEYEELLRLVETEEEGSYTQEGCVGLHYQLLVEGGFKKESRQFEKTHELSSFFLQPRIRQAFLQHDLSTARTLLERRLGWNQPSNGKGSKTIPLGEGRPGVSMPRDIFPHGYATYMEALLEAEQDRDALLLLYRKRLCENSFADKHIDLEKFKLLTDSHWPQERAILLDSIIEGKHPSSLLTDIVTQENLAEPALRYCQVDPPRILGLYRLVGSAYPNEAEELMRGIIEQKLKRTSGREIYRETCSILQKYRTLFGVDKATALMSRMRESYKNRRALLEEFQKLEDSWT